MSVVFFIVLAAFICAIASAIGKAPLWIAAMIQVIPLR